MHGEYVCIHVSTILAISSLAYPNIISANCSLLPWILPLGRKLSIPLNMEYTISVPRSTTGGDTQYSTHTYAHVRTYVCMYSVIKNGQHSDIVRPFWHFVQPKKACTTLCSFHTHSDDTKSFVLRTVLEIRSKWWMDKCPSIIILGQTISDLLRHIFEEVHMYHSRCATADVPQ